MMYIEHPGIAAREPAALAKWYMEKLGATVEVPAKNSTSTEEGDADVIAYFEPVKLVILIQVKKHQGNTDSWAVEQISNYKKNKNMIQDSLRRYKIIFKNKDNRFLGSTKNYFRHNIF